MKCVWNPRHGCEPNCIGDKTFYFQFHHWKDKQFVVEMQPWHFDSHVLILDNIEGTSKPYKISPTHVPFWIRVYDLPFKGRNNEINEKNIGTYINMDKSDVPGKIDGPHQYKKLPFFCYVCGKLGYREKDFDDVTVVQKFNEKLRVSTPWKKNKARGSTGKEEGGVAGRQLFITKGRREKRVEDIVINNVVEKLQEVTIDRSNET
ncbi:Arrestin-related trafficking adapter 10 [Bienertia sinuspersici]